MRKTILVLGSASVMVASAAFAMGGGGGGGGMGGYAGGGLRNMITQDNYSTAVRLIHHEKYADALPYLDHALADRPNNADVLNYLGYTHRMLGDYPISLDFYQRALGRDPDHKGVHEYLGELYLKMHQLDQAKSQLAELTRLCPDDCDEKDVLTKAIGDYELAANAPPQPAATPITAMPAPAPATAPQPAPAAQPATGTP
jgi:tetratricopeptide (TPR) repeat protein